MKKQHTLSAAIRRLDSLVMDRLTTRQQAAAFTAAISYLAAECEKKRVTKQGIFNAIECAAAWADSNSHR